jgi:ABC-2 type transport system ATP-binding protein
VTAASIRLEGTSKWYGEVLGLNDVTATFEPGVSGLLGPNGAGKSTLMKLVCGMLRPSLGTVRVAGEDPFDNPRVLARIGLCPEQDAVYAGVAVLDVLTYLTRLHGFPRHEARERARRALERVGLAGVLGRSAAGFSKGMKQRAKIAQAIAHDPDVLVLDEPLNGLDPPGRREMGDLVRTFGDEGRLVLVSSHILHEVESLAPRVLLLHTGRVLAEGTVAAIRAEMPEHPLTVRVVTGAARALARRLVEGEGVRRIEWVEDGLEVLTVRPDGLFDAVAAAAAEGLEITAVQPVDEDLEAVFRYLTR